MKNLKEMQIACEAILSGRDLESIGGYHLGVGTTYTGPHNPTNVQTSVNGGPSTTDPSKGVINGDDYDLNDLVGPPAPGYFLMEVWAGPGQ